MSSFRIAVVGSGAIGLYYGGKLAAAGRDVHFLMRGDLDEVRRDGLRISGKDEDVHVPSVNVHNSTVEIGPSDLVLIAVKATANAALSELIPPLLHRDTMLMTLQNGFGNEELLANDFGAERVLAGLCFICLSRTARASVHRFDFGHMIIGEYGRPSQPRTHQIASELKASRVECQVVEDLALERWRKLVWNVPFNGLSIVAGGLDTAAILADANLERATLALMDEVIDAANRSGHALERGAAAEQIERTKQMGAYKPSTLLDFEAGKPLEIEAIWGETLRRAATAGASTPRLDQLYSVLKSLDRVRQENEGKRASGHDEG